jgi:hypothetical protein
MFQIINKNKYFNVFKITLMISILENFVWLVDIFLMGNYLNNFGQNYKIKLIKLYQVKNQSRHYYFFYNF